MFPFAPLDIFTPVMFPFAFTASNVPPFKFNMLALFDNSITLYTSAVTLDVTSNFISPSSTVTVPPLSVIAAPP